MRKHDFWPVEWFLNGQKWGVKKASLHVHFEGLTTDSYFGKTRPLGEGHIERRLFNTLLMRKHDFWLVQLFLNGQKWGLKKSFSLCPFWRFDNWLLFWQNKTPWGRLYNKKGILTLFWWEDMTSDLSSCFLNGQKLGVKKAFLYVHFEGLTTDSYFGKTRPSGGSCITKKAF